MENGYSKTEFLKLCKDGCYCDTKTAKKYVEDSDSDYYTEADIMAVYRLGHKYDYYGDGHFRSSIFTAKGRTTKRLKNICKG